MSLYLQDNLDKFIKGADAPVLPSKKEIYASLGIKVNPWPIEITIDKEWVKKLLLECVEYHDGWGEIEHMEEFLEKSKVWNGKIQ